MKLQTEIKLSQEQPQINYSSKILLMGSCFTENMGGKLEYYKFQNLQNPFGIVFHPAAIEKLVTRAINEEAFTEADVFQHNGQWHCFEVHSKLSTNNKTTFISCLNSNLKELKKILEQASHIIFTFGTAWVYRLIETDAIVANCHKVPQKKFLKELLSVEDISAAIENIITLIKAVNPNATVISTISPVRHIKDGFVENMQSKAHLLSGLHEAISSERQAFYFPSFELMMDELRDYRFYEEDMLHPNNVAISIIWERFKNVWIASETEEIQKEIETIQNGLKHRPFNPSSEAHQQFQKNLQKKIASLQEKIPNIYFSI
ncbi:GSCFA domain-containing protein [Marixanthomonas spongiae]|uniref:GSCFA domain-containing protein n=1 Tax=Marixanthomonas spongiae TaxID=2174845 RepID=A0A2U0I7P6_9FLAO|nr:GSCFA domain-containing protein [Marixanthomonas spongiae]PVW17122.1 GSCFA domain-containing protein [Marixanthomonas spongiae]